MATYIILNCIFILVLILVLRITPKKPSRAWLVATMILLLMTAVFDSLIIGYSVVAYDTQKIIGLYIIKAPIEDFFYAIAAMLIVPFIWNKLGDTHDTSN